MIPGPRPRKLTSPLPEPTPHSQDVSISVSVLTLTAISIDRYYAICHPLRFKSNLSHAKRIIALIWAVSLLIMAPDLIYLSAKRSADLSSAGLDTVLYSDCNYDWSDEASRAFQFVKTILLYLIPFLLMFCAHFLMLRELRRAAAASSSASSLSSSVSGHMLASPPALAQQQQRQRHLSRSQSDLELAAEPHSETSMAQLSDQSSCVLVIAPVDAHLGRNLRQGDRPKRKRCNHHQRSPSMAAQAPHNFKRRRRRLREQARTLLPELLGPSCNGGPLSRPRGDDESSQGSASQCGVRTNSPSSSSSTSSIGRANDGSRRQSEKTLELDRVGAGSRRAYRVRFENCHQQPGELRNGNLCAKSSATKCSETTQLPLPVARATKLPTAEPAETEAEARASEPAAKAQCRPPLGRLKKCIGLRQLLAVVGRSFVVLGGADTAKMEAARPAESTNDVEAAAMGSGSSGNSSRKQIEVGRQSCIAAPPMQATNAPDKERRNGLQQQRPIIKMASSGDASVASDLLRVHCLAAEGECGPFGEELGASGARLTNSPPLLQHCRQSAGGLANRDNGTPMLTMHNQNKLESRRKAAKMLTLIVVLFGICYLPVHLINFLRLVAVCSLDESRHTIGNNH